MSRTIKPEFNEVGIARVARWMAFFIWLPAVLAIGFVVYLNFFANTRPSGIRLLLDMNEELLIIGSLGILMTAFCLTVGARDISARQTTWCGCRIYWLISITLYSLPGILLTSSMSYSFYLALSLGGLDFLDPSLASFYIQHLVIGVPFLGLGLACLAMACLSGIALYQHLLARAYSQPEKEAQA